MTDTPESVRAVSESMRRLVTARAVDVAEDWRVNGPRTPVLDAHNMLARYAVLLEQVAAHERHGGREVMMVDKARKIMQDMQDHGGQYFDYLGDGHMVLDGEFTSDDLEAITVWMRDIAELQARLPGME